MERNEQVAVGSLKEAKRKLRMDKYEPLKFVKALNNALHHGIGFSLDKFLPLVHPPRNADLITLSENPTFIFLTDMEPQQYLD